MKVESESNPGNRVRLKESFKDFTPSLSQGLRIDSGHPHGRPWKVTERQSLQKTKKESSLKRRGGVRFGRNPPDVRET